MRTANNFDALRLLAALLVVLSHAMAHFVTIDWLAKQTNSQSFGGIGLNIFCVISGYLITQSRMRNTAIDFARARALRILPALCAAVLLMAFVVGPLATKLNTGVYFTQGATWRFLLSMMVFPLNPVLPGVFAGVALIGQLYSLTAEVAFYILAGVVGRWKHFPPLVAILLVLVWSFLILANYSVLPFTTVIDLRLGSATFFFYPVRLSTLCVFYLLMGSALARLPEHERFLTRLAPVFLTVWAVALVSNDRRAYDMVEMAILPLAVIGIGLSQRYSLRLPKWLGDISYGTYIYHFVVVESLALVVAPQYRERGVAGALVLSALAGWLSFHLVEKHPLAWKARQTRNAVRNVSVAAQAAEV